MKIIYKGGMPSGTIGYQGQAIEFERDKPVYVPETLGAELIKIDDADPTPENPLQRKPVWISEEK